MNRLLADILADGRRDAEVARALGMLVVGSILLLWAGNRISKEGSKA